MGFCKRDPQRFRNWDPLIYLFIFTNISKFTRDQRLRFDHLPLYTFWTWLMVWILTVSSKYKTNNPWIIALLHCLQWIYEFGREGLTKRILEYSKAEERELWSTLFHTKPNGDFPCNRGKVMWNSLLQRLPNVPLSLLWGPSKHNNK